MVRPIAGAPIRSITLSGSGANAAPFRNLLEKWNKNRSGYENRFHSNAHEEEAGRSGGENVSEEQQWLARGPENPKRDPQAPRSRPIAIPGRRHPRTRPREASSGQPDYRPPPPRLA